MIPFGSQRGSGQDLAIHLMNGEDNEYVELLHLEGAIAKDLPGAFAEWEVVKSMTRCEQELYSLSVNPDPNQPAWPEPWIFEYRERVAETLGLAGQPHAIVKHVKEDKLGRLREHFHVVWSRIDVQEMKAIHLAFDHDKLMAVTRQFARDHDIELAAGYFKLEDRKRQDYRQKSLYEKAQEDRGGLSREEHMAIVSELWHGRDTPDSFIKALEHHGYILASGDKRPYVLVDTYGHMNSLPKVIDDRAANTRAIRGFLGEDYELPSIEEARDVAERHRQALDAFKQAETRANELDKLKARQAQRRAELEQKATQQREQHDDAQKRIEQGFASERSDLRAAYLSDRQTMRDRREAHRPTGLTAFLSRVSGMDLVRDKVHRYQDRKRYEAYRLERDDIRHRQAAEREELQRSQEMQALDMERQRRNLDRLDKRERDSFERSLLKEQRVYARGRNTQAPEPALALKPPGRRAVLHKAKSRFQTDAFRNRRDLGRKQNEQPDLQERLQDTFARATNSQPVRRVGEMKGGIGESRGMKKVPAESGRTGNIGAPAKTSDPLPRIGEPDRNFTRPQPSEVAQGFDRTRKGELQCSDRTETFEIRDEFARATQGEPWFENSQGGSSSEGIEESQLPSVDTGHQPGPSDVSPQVDFRTENTGTSLETPDQNDQDHNSPAPDFEREPNSTNRGHDR
ncbi:MAG: relaxase [Hyphomicrobiales bacterium]|nr:relaxase [Hyphomicrobiales bacterium]MCP5372054.1 relaxase [Hyphomicrobiales bacterium]